jgi:hypothetical protein
MDFLRVRMNPAVVLYGAVSASAFRDELQQIFISAKYCSGEQKLLYKLVLVQLCGLLFLSHSIYQEIRYDLLLRNAATAELDIFPFSLL